MVLLHWVDLTPTPAGANVPVGMFPDLHALFLGDGMVMLDIDADSHAFEKALASARQAFSADFTR